MSFTDWLKGTRDKIGAEITKFRNKDFMEAVVAGCALVAYADGQVSSEEKQKMVRYMQMSDALKHFDMKQVIDGFNSFVTKFDFDTMIGKGEALKTISRLKSKPEDARMLVRVCCAIGASDGNFDESEKQVIREICFEQGLQPNEFSL